MLLCRFFGHDWKGVGQPVKQEPVSLINPYGIIRSLEWFEDAICTRCGICWTERDSDD